MKNILRLALITLTFATTGLFAQAATEPAATPVHHTHKHSTKIAKKAHKKHKKHKKQNV